MTIYLLLFALFLIQEPVSSGAVLLEAYQNHYNVWIIHGLFVAATVLDIVVGYYVGRLLHTRYKETRFMRYLERKTQSFMDFGGKHGRRVALLIFGQLIFPLSAFMTPWLGMSFWESSLLLFAGELVFWYGSEWLLVLGTKTFIPDPQYALYAILIFSAAITIGLRQFRKKRAATSAVPKSR